MKILYPDSCAITTYEYRRKPVRPQGGEEVLWCHILDALLDLGHDVTVITPNPETFPNLNTHPNLRILPTTKYQLIRTVRKNLTKAVYDEYRAGNYDKILSTSARHLIFHKDWSGMGKDLVMMHQCPLGMLDTRAFLRFFPEFELWARAGAKHVVVRPNYIPAFNKRLNIDVLKRHPSYNPEKPIDFDTLLQAPHYFDIFMASTNQPLPNPQLRYCGMGMGRLSTIKRLKFSAKVLSELSRRTGKPSILHTISPRTDQNKRILAEIQSIVNSQPLLHLHIDSSRETILDNLSQSAVMVNPTALESTGGLVSFEAIAGGIPLVCSLDLANLLVNRYDADGTFIPRRTLNAYVDAGMSHQVYTSNRLDQYHKVRSMSTPKEFANRVAHMLS